ncbi:MAG TPA: long-chain fatty acid--CoA ligase [Spirochaetota bacterium]|nr:long-chain fatty acid--CoA ligase [Spirochaetota bacterium]HPC41345.1 long-chain fatty acid--CoA ligase [Spirochaetota bacterium]HPL15440.1 long-chain fatty acid--CoA ligase [Spirochaetota bacterium]HQF09724.1 long-chain fatty acid--CoA ligase [Spirochaetota bacterium]HQH99464.1 long-chain fatty acid--CoA ligase [Spirochaetota bacterium]
MAKFKEICMPAIFQNQAEKLGDKACVAYKKGGKYVDISWTEMNRMIHDLAYYLLSIGVKKNDKIALFSPNRWEWWVASQATLSIGAVSVPIYATNSSEECLYIIDNSDSRLCFAGTEDHLNRVLKVKPKLKKLKQLVVFDDYSKKTKDVLTINEAFKIGQGYKKKNEFDKRLAAIKPDDVSTLIYTSGTTGNPKGVMLTHNNFVSNATNVYGEVKDYMTDKDIMLSFLPLSHSLEMTCGYYIPVLIGAKVAFAEDISKLMENFQDVRPTIIISVPRIYEKVHAGILAKVADGSAVKKAIFKWAMKMAAKNLPYECRDKERTGLFAKQYNLADKLVFSNLKKAIGLDRLKFAISGGGPLSVSDAEFFIGMGIKILEGFGLTETTPVTHFNRKGMIKPGTVGHPIPHTKVKIADDGELLIKGPQVMKGYYKNPAATKEVFTKDGYFRTGDIAAIDEEGFLKITGRIKDIIVTAGGKNISPQNIENSLKTSPFIEQVAVIGDRRKYLTALVIPAFDAVMKWAKKNGLEVSGHKDLIERDEVQKLIAGEIEKYTKQYARVEQIRKFKLLDAEWTQQTGELTPTQKVKRRIIESKYAKEIDSLYPADAD